MVLFSIDGVFTWGRFLTHKKSIVANMKHASTYSPVAFRSLHTGIEPPFLLKYIMRLLLA